MDGDGNVEKGAVSRYSTVSKQLVDDIVYLVKSLGGWATYRLQENHTGLGDRGWIYRVNISHHNRFNPFRLKRKADLYCEQKKFLTRGIKSITYSRHGDGVCFSVAHPDHCFIVGDFVVTHNTDAQLIRFRRNVGIGYGEFWRGVIFDREYKNLDDLVAKSMRWFPNIDPEHKPRFLSSKSDYRWVWPTGEQLLFRVVKKDADYWSYHGQEFPWIGWNELTKFPTDILFDAMMSCNRSSFRPQDYPQTIKDEYGNKTQTFLPEMPLEVFATCNPHGVGHNWVKKRFIAVAPMGRIVTRVVNAFNPRTQQREDVKKTQVHLFGSYKENIYLSPEYIAELESITDPNKKKAWLNGDWDIVAGGMFDDVWNKEHHILRPFDVPHNWKIDRSFDWGSSKPFSVGWWAESDGSDVRMANGEWRSTVCGDIFRIAEWYGTNGKTNQGLRMLATEVAAGIVEREIAMGIYGRVHPGPADNSIWDIENGNSLAADMLKPVNVAGRILPGVQWTRSDKSSGSRIAGWELCRQYLKDALPQYVKDKEGKLVRVPRRCPGMFIFNTCKHFIELFPILPRDEDKPDDVDTDAEDHIGDEVRYEVLSKATGIRTGTTKGT